MTEYTVGRIHQLTTEPLACSAGGIPYNRAHLEAKDEEIRRLQAEVEKWHRKAMDAGVIVHSDGSTSHPMRAERDRMRTLWEQLEAHAAALKEAVDADDPRKEIALRVSDILTLAKSAI